MGKFNLKTYQKISGDEHIEMRLKEQHVEAPNQINEAQLEDYRGTEANVTIEKLLEKSRTSDNPILTEGGLDKNKAKFAIKHRNSDANSGDINKLEEKRLTNEPTESVKYELAASTPKKSRWWEGGKSPDGLKLTKSNKSIKTAAEDEAEVGDVLESLELPEDNKGIEEKIKRIEDGGDFEIQDVDKDEELEDDFEVVDGGGESATTPIEPKMKVIKEKTFSGAVPGIYMVVGYNKDDFPAATEEERKEKIEDFALSHIVKVRPELSGLIDTSDLYDMKEVGSIGSIALRAIGDKYAGLFPSEEEVQQEEKPILFEKPADRQEAEEGTLEDLEQYYNIIESFEKISFDKKDIDGTPMAFGKIKTTTPVTDENRKNVIKAATDYILSEYTEIGDINENSLDLSKVNEGEISFITSVEEIKEEEEVEEPVYSPIPEGSDYTPPTQWTPEMESQYPDFPINDSENENEK